MAVTAWAAGCVSLTACAGVTSALASTVACTGTASVAVSDTSGVMSTFASTEGTAVNSAVALLSGTVAVGAGDAAGFRRMIVRAATANKATATTTAIARTPGDRALAGPGLCGTVGMTGSAASGAASCGSITDGVEAAGVSDCGSTSGGATTGGGGVSGSTSGILAVR